MENSKNNLTMTIVVGIVALIIGAAGGYYFAPKTATPTGAAGGARSNGNFSGARGNRGNGFVSGLIIKADSQSLSVQAADGSSKLVFFSGTTAIMKAATGTPADLVIGKNVTIMGTTNSDGSVSAQTIQLRPAGQPGFGNGQGGPSGQGAAMGSGRTAGQGQ